MDVDDQIMSNLLAHEGREDVTPSSPLAEEEAEYSSSSDENSTGVHIDKDSTKEDSSEEDEFTVRVSMYYNILVVWSCFQALFLAFSATLIKL